MLLDKTKIKEIIPYQEPFLFVDGVEEIGENTISGFYQTSKDDYYFKGHFVDFKIMPGVLVVEAMAQLSTILLRQKIGESHKNYHFLAYDVRSCQFFKPIFPGDKIILKAEVLGIYLLPDSENKIARIKSQALVKEELKTEARFSVAIIKKKEFEEKVEKDSE
jgi:3-hydroxymyristoyl/3-hydroxydecanoyl-(acyl carrier protein) dehydratase